jgi:hypothetical protein
MLNLTQAIPGNRKLKGRLVWTTKVFFTAEIYGFRYFFRRKFTGSGIVSGKNVCVPGGFSGENLRVPGFFSGGVGSVSTPPQNHTDIRNFVSEGFPDIWTISWLTDVRNFVSKRFPNILLHSHHEGSAEMDFHNRNIFAQSFNAQSVFLWLDLFS